MKGSRVAAMMKTLLPLVVSLLALALGVANFLSNQRAMAPREVLNTDWVRSLPQQPGTCRLVPLAESFELLGYDGFRLFARLPRIEVKPGQALYYLYGRNVYEGQRDKQRLVHKGMGIEDVVNAGGSVSLSHLPEGFEYTVFFRRDKAKGGISGSERFGFVDPARGERVNGDGSPFSVELPPFSGLYSTVNGDRPEVELGRPVEFAERTFVPHVDGGPDYDHAVTVKWYYLFKVAPRAF